MKTIVSAAVTADGCMDDCSARRLVISNARDWEEVYRLRAWADAILVGAETVRRDDPSLRLKSVALCDERLAAGLAAEPARVVLTRTGRLDPRSRLFTSGTGRRLVLAAEGADRKALARLEGVAKVIVRPEFTPQVVEHILATEGIERLMIEGGARVLSAFFEAGAVDAMRLAVSSRRLDEPTAPHLTGSGAMPYDRAEQRPRLRARYKLDGIEVGWWDYVRPGADASEFDKECMAEAVELSRRCVPSPTNYSVGCVIVALSGRRYTGYTHQRGPADHAEEVALAAAREAGEELCGATVYTSLEPCSRRASKPVSCTQLLIEAGVARVVYAWAEPDCFVHCEGAALLRAAGIEVEMFDRFAGEVARINGHIIRR